MFTPSSLHPAQTAAEQAVMGGVREVAWQNFRITIFVKQAFCHLPNSPELGSEAER